MEIAGGWHSNGCHTCVILPPHPTYVFRVHIDVDPCYNAQKIMLPDHSPGSRLLNSAKESAAMPICVALTGDVKSESRVARSS